MSRNAAALVLIAVSLLGGCVRSLQPFHTPDQVVFDPALVGEWASKNESWTVTRARGNGYRLVHADGDGRIGTFNAHLFRVAGTLFVDLAPVRTDGRESEFYDGHLLTTHTVFIVTQTAPAPRFLFLSEKWLAELLRVDPGALSHQRFGDDIVITASTREVQAFLLRHRHTSGAFEAVDSWHRVTATP